MTARIALFIDGAILHYTARNLGFETDYERLIFEFENFGSIVRSYFYTTVAESEFNSVRPLTDWLGCNEFTVRTKSIRDHDEDEHKWSRRNIGVDLAVEIAGRLDGIYLFSGDGDFRALVEAVQRRGVRVTVVSSLRTRPAVLADELRRQADEFLELAILRGSIERSAQQPV